MKARRTLVHRALVALIGITSCIAPLLNAPAAEAQVTPLPQCSVVWLTQPDASQCDIVPIATGAGQILFHVHTGQARVFITIRNVDQGPWTLTGPAAFAFPIPTWSGTAGVKARLTIRGLVAGTVADATALSPSPTRVGRLGDVIFTGQASFGPAVPLIGGTGTFGFLSTACIVVGAGGSGFCSLNVSGTYDSTACGLGYAVGSGQITGPDPYVVDAFGIIFNGSIGIVYGQITSTVDGTQDDLYGMVQLSPVNAPGPGGCVSSAEATGVVAAAVSS